MKLYVTAVGNTKKDAVAGSSVVGAAVLDLGRYRDATAALKTKLDDLLLRMRETATTTNVSLEKKMKTNAMTKKTDDNDNALMELLTRKKKTNPGDVVSTDSKLADNAADVDVGPNRSNKRRCLSGKGGTCVESKTADDRNAAVNEAADDVPDADMPDDMASLIEYHSKAVMDADTLVSKFARQAKSAAQFAMKAESNALVLVERAQLNKVDHTFAEHFAASATHSKYLAESTGAEALTDARQAMKLADRAAMYAQSAETAAAKAAGEIDNARRGSTAAQENAEALALTIPEETAVAADAAAKDAADTAVEEAGDGSVPTLSTAVVTAREGVKRIEANAHTANAAAGDASAAAQRAAALKQQAAAILDALEPPPATQLRSQPSSPRKGKNKAAKANSKAAGTQQEAAPEL